MDVSDRRLQVSMLVCMGPRGLGFMGLGFRVTRFVRLLGLGLQIRLWALWSDNIPGFRL